MFIWAQHVRKALINSKNGVHTLSGVGADIWNSYDEFDFAYVKLTGDMQIVARVTSTELINNWTKAGVMIRESLKPFSKYAYMLYAPQNLVRLPKIEL